MKNLNPKKKVSLRKYLIILTVITAIVLAGMSVYGIATWFDTHKLVFNQPVKMSFLSPVEIKERKVQVIEKMFKPATPEQVDTPIKEYACKKWGEFNCLVMIAVFQAESGWDNTKWHYNDNATLDFGIAEINSVNWKLEGCSLKEIVDEYKNIDCAYKIWDRADGKEGNNKGSFEPWVAFTNSNYLSKL